MKELLDITTRHVSTEEAIGAIFIQSCGKVTPSGGRGAPPKASNKGTKRRARSDNRGPKRWPQQVTVTTSCDEGDNDKDVGDSDEELIATTESEVKCQARLLADHFEELLKVTCPNHRFPIRNKLKECPMMKNYMTMRTFVRGKKHESDSTGRAAAPFHEERADMLIYGGSPSPTSNHGVSSNLPPEQSMS
jgi:hypothetical protein